MCNFKFWWKENEHWNIFRGKNKTFHAFLKLPLIRKVWLNHTVFHKRWAFKENEAHVLWFTTPTLREYKSPGAGGDIHSLESHLQPSTKSSNPDTMSFYYGNYCGLGYGLGYGSNHGLGGYGYGCGYLSLFLWKILVLWILLKTLFICNDRFPWSRIHHPG